MNLAVMVGASWLANREPVVVYIEVEVIIFRICYLILEKPLNESEAVINNVGISQLI